MKKEEYKKNYLPLLVTFMKLGIFAIGGGPALIGLLKGEIVDKKKWLNDEELTTMIGLSESTPGPIAINIATYLGYERAGVFGSILATFGIVFPSFLIMFLISLFFDKIIAVQAIKFVFLGIKCGVAFIISRVAIQLIKGLKKQRIAQIIFAISLITLIVLTILCVEYSSLYFILGGFVVGIIIYGLIIGKKRSEK